MLPEEKRIKTKQQLQEYIACESSRYHSNFLFRLLELTEGNILCKYQHLLRKTEFHHNTHHRLRSLFYKYRLVRMSNRYSLHVPINVCEKGLHFLHVGPILISCNAQVGQKCSFHINTALVNQGRNAQAPTLGNGIVMGVGSICVGGIHVADNVAIGANAVVTKDITEPNIAVGGVPAKKISNNGRLEWNKK